jgi:hypothetical protein
LTIRYPLGRAAGRPHQVDAVWLTTALPAAIALSFALILIPSVFIDDAAITLRYVERLVAGQGFTYNDHEHVLGASNPLYTLVLAALHWCGMPLAPLVTALGVAPFVATVALSAYLVTRLVHPWAGLTAGALLACDRYFSYQALCGMESSLAACLGLAVLVSLWHEEDMLAGFFLGLAVWNKLDAGLLAVPVAGACLVTRRQWPWTLSVTSAAMVLPWLIFATW